VRVVCTAGHVDHGKSSLVRALTGMEPDRFDEERRRGLTIDLGFAWARIAAHTVAFVDLPGHERFVGNMLAGAGPVETALFVVAADEGWMPQSQEHLDILDLLGVQRGVVALTKSDAVDTETLELAEALVRERLAGTGLFDAPIVACSSVRESGLPELRERLAAVLDDAPAAADRARPRLWADRVFSVRGAGTVVTGTLGGGSLHVGQEVVALPGGRAGRVRGLQSLGEPVERAAPGARVAVNVSGLERDAVGRGDALVLSGQWPATDSVEAWVRVLPGMVLERRGAWHLHAGSAKRMVTVAPVEGRPLRADGFVRLELDEPLPLSAGDGLVLRESGRWATAAGGVVLDADPPPRAKGRSRPARAAALAARRAALEAADLPQLLALHVAERGAAPLDAAAAAVGLTAEQAREAARASRLLPLGPALVHPSAAATWSQAVLEALRAHHRAHPLERAAPKDLAVRAATAAGCPAALAAPFLDALVALRRVGATGPGLRDPSHVVQLDASSSAARAALLAALDAQPLSPPRLSSAAAEAGAPPVLVRELEAAGELVRLGPELAFTESALGRAAAQLREAFTGRAFTASEAKETWGTTRKYAMPLLEEMDRRGVTVREGDLRTLRA
jgi:selenocysteine-specific elongation factor